MNRLQKIVIPGILALLLSCAGSADDAGTKAGTLTQPTCEGDCQTLGESCCNAREDCRDQRGSVIREDGCAEESRFAGCFLADTNCPNQAGYARDTDGRCWSFGNLCIPGEFTQLSGDEAQVCRLDFSASEACE